MKAPGEMMLTGNDVETLWALQPLLVGHEYTTISNGELLPLISGVSTHSAVSRRVQRLKDRGIVEIGYANDKGRSRRYVSLTPAGRKAVEMIASYQEG